MAFAMIFKIIFTIVGFILIAGGLIMMMESSHPRNNSELRAGAIFLGGVLVAIGGALLILLKAFY